jgi:hypothetical protein
VFDIRIYSGEEIDYLKILPSTIRSLSMSIWIQQCKSQISSSYHIHITFISHSYHIHITIVSHSYHSVTQTIHHILALDSVTVTSHHPRWPNVLFQQGTSEWQPVKKCKEDRERMGKVWKGTQMLRICWLLYSRSQMYIIYIRYIYPMVVGNQYICQTVERALQSANLSIYLNFKESFPLTCCLDSKVHSSAYRSI